jgi:hypothetical protein
MENLGKQQAHALLTEGQKPDPILMLQQQYIYRRMNMIATILQISCI